MLKLYWVISMNKPIRKAVRTFIIKNDKVLAIKYLTEKNNGFYDIPGGMLENCEKNYDTSIRECLEETGIKIINQRYMGNLIIEYPEVIFDLDVFLCNNFNGSPSCFIKNESMWIEINNLLAQAKKLPSIDILKSEYKKYFQYGNFKIKLIVDNNHKIIKSEIIDSDIGYVKMWDNWSKKRIGLPAYDNWLDDYKDILSKNKNYEILDLGCGIGADTLYLLERDFKVLSCDFSIEALENIQKNISNSKTQYLDMIEPFPFADESYSLIIADLSLHYFDNETTIHIMNEIKRILKNDGILLARVASVNDFNFGAGVGEQLEKNFYFEGDYTKRFFDQADVNKYFGIIGEVEALETSMIRDEEEYSKSKILYQVKVKKEK